MTVALVDTIPKDARNQGSINLGFEIVREGMKADPYHWTDTLLSGYQTIAFNVFYPMHLLNIVPFLMRNGIHPLKTNRKGPRIIVGGQGVGRNDILAQIADDIYPYEFDLQHNQHEVVSNAHFKGNKGVIELTRGCKYRCKFCEYSWVWGGKYREKPIELVREQMLTLRGKGIKAVNFLSANFAGYSKLDDLIESAQKEGIQILNADSCINDMHKLTPHLKVLPRYIKMGVESFDEATRFSVGKRITDVKLEETIDELLRHANGLHFYLIYGLPDDKYESWYAWLKRLGMKRKEYRDGQTNLFGEHKFTNTKNIRFELSTTNFEPCIGTPLEHAPMVDFRKKDEFMSDWGACMIAEGFFKGESIGYHNWHGRIGRKELSYKMLMTLKRGGPELTERLIYGLPNGVGRSVDDKQAKRFLK